MGNRLMKAGFVLGNSGENQAEEKFEPGFMQVVASHFT